MVFRITRRHCSLRHATSVAAALTLFSGVFLGSTLATAPARAAGDSGPDTCLEGFVWREATSQDHVCVTPATREQTVFDNGQAAARRSPTGGASGADTCLPGYVWREAVPDDHVCVTPETRAQAAADNGLASRRRNSLLLLTTRYTLAPRCTGGTCETTSVDDLPRYRLRVFNINIGTATVILRHKSSKRTIQRWRRATTPAADGIGARLVLSTGRFACGGTNDSEFLVRDPISTRWSRPLAVSALCARL